MTFRKTLLAATMLALPLAAQAQPVTGLYVAGAGGANWQNSEAVNVGASAIGAATTNAFSARFGTNTGWLVLGSIGWGFGNGLRLEAEGSYRTNDVNSANLNVTGFGRFPTFGRSGYTSTMGLMANVMYDIGSTMRWPVYITVGAGVGYAWSRWSGVGFTDVANETVRFNGTDGSFAWQGIAGLTYPIRAVPGLSLTAEYRYFATQDNTYSASITAPTATGRLPSASASNVNQSALFGVRYNFGQSPPAPPPAAAPAPARSFLVFFDFARDDLTARAREIIGQAAQASRSQQVTRIEVAGHTDTVGSAQYNQGLSQRRANNVAAELVRLGVPRQSIQTAAYGFTRPLVPTGPNVREPQNRRVEIVLR